MVLNALGRPLASSLLRSIPRPPTFHLLPRSWELGCARRVCVWGGTRGRGWEGGDGEGGDWQRPVSRVMPASPPRGPHSLPFPSCPVSPLAELGDRPDRTMLFPGGPISSRCERAPVCAHPSTGPEANGSGFCPSLRRAGDAGTCPSGRTAPKLWAQLPQLGGRARLRPAPRGPARTPSLCELPRGCSVIQSVGSGRG